MKTILTRIFNKAFPKDQFFDKILAVTLSFEGEYTEKDEPTYKGITERTYKTYAEQHDWFIKEDIQQLTDDEIWEIYYNEFYLRPKIFILPKEIQGLVFDFNVNSGARAIRELQRTLGIKIDSHIGNDTRNASERYIKNFGVNSFIVNYHKRRKDVMYETIIKDSTKKQFWNGWMNRLEKLKEIYKQQ